MVTFFFFNDTATTEIYTLSLHDALPISLCGGLAEQGIVHQPFAETSARLEHLVSANGDRKSTRLNSSHVRISYAVFCLKKKKQRNYHQKIRKPESESSHITKN